MAGDWIKMRTDLYRNPKVIIIADTLMSDDGELSTYVSQHCQRNMTVTRNVMRNVTVGALVSVWGVLRTQGKRKGDDLFLSGSSISVIDDIADLPGFGDAMMQVGWVVEKENGILFPRFFEENNVDPSEKYKSANAERQARYREKKKSDSNVTGNVTGNVTDNVTRDVIVTDREEKSREDNTPPTPKGGDADKTQRKRKPPEEPKPWHTESIAAFCEMWYRQYGDNYPFDKKDGPAIAWMIEHVNRNVERMKSIFVRYLAERDPFFAGHPISKLRSQFPRFIAGKLTSDIYD